MFPALFRSAASGCALAVLVPSVLGLQLAGPDFETSPRVLGEDHFDGRGAVFGRVRVAELTGDLRPEIVQMADLTVAVFFGPGLYQGVSDIPFDVIDVTVLPRGGTAGRDALVTSSARGLERWTADLEANAWQGAGLGSIAFAGASRVECGDVDGDGSDDVVALMGNGRELRVLYDASGSSSESEVPVVGVASDFVLLDWEAGGPLELALATSQGIRVQRLDGTTLYLNGAGGIGDLVAPLPGDGSGDRLAAVVRPGASMSWLIVADAAAGEEPALRLGPFEVVGAGVADIDDDGDPDLALSHKGSNELWFLDNQGVVGESFSLVGSAFSAFPTQPEVGPAEGNEAWPALVDLDQDGDLDLTFAVQGDEWVSVFGGRARAHLDGAPSFSAHSYAWDGDTQSGVLSLSIDAPVIPWPGATDVEVVVWRQPDASLEVERVALSYDLVPIDGSWPIEYSIDVDEPIASLAVRDIEARLVELDDGRDRVVRAAPTYAEGFATRLSVLFTLAQLFGIEPLYEVIELTGYEYVQGQSSDIGTGVVPLDEIPCFAEDDFPKQK